MTSPAPGQFPPAAQCAPIAVLALEVLADLRQWAARYPVVGTAPLEAMALSTATISPWRQAGELRLVARMYAWAYALDDQVEQATSTLDELDDLFDRCNTIVRTGKDDDSRPLLSALSDWQADINQEPGYPALAELWSRQVAKALDDLRYDWNTGRTRDHGRAPSDAEEYLDHANSILVWITHLARWVTTDQHGLLDRLPLLSGALDNVAVAIRLANDLATFSWERTQPEQNNILMYGITPDQVRAELDRQAEAARRTLAPLVARDFPPAHEMLRLLEWSVAFYAVADFRGWGSDVPAGTTSSEAGARP